MLVPVLAGHVLSPSLHFFFQEMSVLCSHAKGQAFYL